MPSVKGKGGGSHPGNPRGKRGRPLRPVPEEITQVVLSSATPLPCLIRNFDNKSGICGKPATVAYVYPAYNYHSPGCWIVQPVCRECNAATVRVYEPDRGIVGRTGNYTTGDDTMKEQALAQARQMGRSHGRTVFNARGYVGVVDVVSECPAVGQWLDTLTSDPHTFNEAHAELWQAYSSGYDETLPK